MQEEMKTSKQKQNNFLKTYHKEAKEKIYSNQNKLKENINTEEITDEEMEIEQKHHFMFTTLSLCGVIIIVVSLLLGIVTTVPGLVDYNIYQIIGGSMEPEIPAGSAVFVKECGYELIEEQDIIAYTENESILVHRVIKKDLDNRWLFTKGDAKGAADTNPVSETQLIGKVTIKIPLMGGVLSFCTTKLGKVYLMGFVFVGVFINFLGEKAKNSWIRKKYLHLKIFWVVLFTLFALIMFYLVWVSYPYLKAKSYYNKAAEKYVTYSRRPPNEISKVAICPITIDFDELQETNPEIVGWIYCENTSINYPVCQGKDNEFYLNHGYDGSNLKSGTIFMKAENATDLSDCNTFLYGHYTRDGSMFTALSKWSSQRYYETHETMWYLTKDKTYQVKIFAGFVTVATSDTYMIHDKSSDKFGTYLQETMKKSYIVPTEDIKASLEENPDELSVMVLSTCDYTYKDARYVLCGILEECQ